MDIEYNRKFWLRQFLHIKKGGWSEVKRKVKLSIEIYGPIPLIGFIVSVPLVLIVRLIRPWILIRFGFIIFGRIGHNAFDLEYYLTEKRLGLHPERSMDLFFNRGGKSANNFYLILGKRNLKISNFYKYPFLVNALEIIKLIFNRKLPLFNYRYC